MKVLFRWSVPYLSLSRPSTMYRKDDRLLSLTWNHQEYRDKVKQQSKLIERKGKKKKKKGINTPQPGRSEHTQGYINYFQTALTMGLSSPRAVI